MEKQNANKLNVFFRCTREYSEWRRRSDGHRDTNISHHMRQKEKFIFVRIECDVILNCGARVTTYDSFIMK